MTPLAARAAAALALAVASAALQGCDDPVRRPEALRVNARSGAQVDVSGTTWEVCLDAVPAAGQSQRERIVHGEDGIVTYTSQPFDQPACAGTAGSLLSLSFVGFDEGDRAVSWSGTPPAELPASPVATKVLLDGARLFADCLWLDDLSSPRVLYAGAPNSTFDADGFPDLLLFPGYAEVQ